MHVLSDRTLLLFFKQWPTMFLVTTITTQIHNKKAFILSKTINGNVFSKSEIIIRKEGRRFEGRINGDFGIFRFYYLVGPSCYCRRWPAFSRQLLIVKRRERFNFMLVNWFWRNVYMTYLGKMSLHHDLHSCLIQFVLEQNIGLILEMENL